MRIDMHQVRLSGHDALKSLGLRPGRYIWLSFADTGRGIDPQMLPRVFDPFFTTKEVGQGSGMGLAIVHAMMESYGGAITVESEADKGATLHLYFPVTE